ncbi:helix-turn-helix domain-containing protein [Actinopolymorpha pittospori]
MLMPARVNTDDAVGFHASLGATDLGAQGISTVAFSSLRPQRTPKPIQGSDPEPNTAGLAQGEQQSIAQAAHEAIVGRGDLVVCSSSWPFEARVAADGRAASVVAHVPRVLIPLPQDRIERLLAVPLRGREGIGDVLTRFLAHLAIDAGARRPEESPHLGAVLVDLLTALLARHLEAGEAVPVDTRQRALFLQVQRFIQRHLGDPDLTPTVVATANHISIRYLHQIFRQHGCTVSASIRQLRLHRCHADLASPALRLTPISELAARWGFIRPAVFTRAFRAAYGLSPREYRRRALADLHADGQ